MKIAQVDHAGQNLSVQRLNTPYVSEIKSGIAFWLTAVLLFGIFSGLSVGYNAWLRHMGSTAPNDLMSLDIFLLWAVLIALVIIVNLCPSFLDMASPRLFCFDQENNAFWVDGKNVSSLDRISLRLQDGWGTTRRAFRLVVLAEGKVYVLAQTQRFTSATLNHTEYYYLGRTEGRAAKYRFFRWASYEGQNTGFSKDWPGYTEIFALYEDLFEFIESRQPENTPV